MLARMADNDIPDLLHGPITLDRGVPRYWGNIWDIVESGRLAESTRYRKLGYVDDLYTFADHLVGPGTFDRALSKVDEKVLSKVLQSWFVEMRNKPHITESDHAKWKTGLSFVKNVAQWIGRIDAPLPELNRKLHRLNSLYSQLRVIRHRRKASIRSLPANVVTELYSLFDPGSPDNPFNREQIKWRNYALFLLCFHQGLRRAEALILPADAIKSEYDQAHEKTRYWINVTENHYQTTKDKRFSAPSIKSGYSHRQIPVTESTARVIENYAINYRGRPSHSYLLNSQHNRPLSTEAVTKAFAKINSVISKESKRSLQDKSQKCNVAPHDLRHTAAVVRLNQFLNENTEMDVALQMLRAFFGWSRTSKMPLRYAHAVFVDRMSSVWSEAFDNQVEVMRILGGNSR